MPRTSLIAALAAVLQQDDAILERGEKLLEEAKAAVLALRHARKSADLALAARAVARVKEIGEIKTLVPVSGQGKRLR